MSTISPPRLRMSQRGHTSHKRSQARALLGRYTDPRGREREVLCRPGVGESVLVIDRLAGSLADERLVAHLAADEPAENAGIVCALYLADERGRRCRRLAPQDLETAPPLIGATHTVRGPSGALETDGARLVDRHSRGYRLELARSGKSIPELRWWRKASGEGDTPSEMVSVREAIGALEGYEPVRSITAQALAAHASDAGMSVAVLRGELRSLDGSRVVLNRGLREAVQAAVEKGGLSMSEIAIRCGRFKHDSRGSATGATSWLARRIGQAPEGGEDFPSPWIHSETLALIARQGLGISPREVELG